MTRARRLSVFGAGAAGLALLLAWAVAGLDRFGNYAGDYGTTLVDAAPAERHVANVVAAVVFDYRGFDTIGEQLILFCAVMGVALLLREHREEDVARARDEVTSEAVRAMGVVAVPVVILLAADVVMHGYLTPGGGFQGGVVAAAGLLLVYLAAEWRAYHRAVPARLVDPAEAIGAAGFVALGVATLATSGVFLENALPLGDFGSLLSGGTIGVANWCAGIEVAAAFILIFSEFLTEIVSERMEDGAT